VWLQSTYPGGASEADNKAESIIEREIRTSLEREKEWAALHRVTHYRHIPSPTPPALTSTDGLSQTRAPEVVESHFSVTSLRATSLHDVGSVESGLDQIHPEYTYSVRIRKFYNYLNAEVGPMVVISLKEKLLQIVKELQNY